MQLSEDALDLVNSRITQLRENYFKSLPEYCKELDFAQTFEFNNKNIINKVTKHLIKETESLIFEIIDVYVTGFEQDKKIINDIDYQEIINQIRAFIREIYEFKNELLNTALEYNLISSTNKSDFERSEQYLINMMEAKLKEKKAKMRLDNLSKQANSPNIIKTNVAHSSNKMDLIRQQLSDLQKTAINITFEAILIDREQKIRQQHLCLKMKTDEESLETEMKKLGGKVFYLTYDDPTKRKCGLSFTGLLLTNKGKELEKLLIRYLTFVKQQISSNPEILTIRLQEVIEKLELTNDESKLLGLSFCIGCNPFGSATGSVSDPDISLPTTITKLNLAENVDDYFYFHLSKNIDTDVPIDGNEQTAYFTDKYYRDQQNSKALRSIDPVLNNQKQEKGIKLATITWLHLTDLHQGLHGQKWLYPTIRQAFYEDLEKLHEKISPIDLVLFTGDLTQGDKTIEDNKQQFEAFESTLQHLWEHLANLGSYPKLLVVPGNHDLFRPNEDLPIMVALESWHNKEKIRTAFWNNPNSDYRKLIEKAFTQYQEWLTSTKIPLVPYNKGLLPGDFSATYEKNNIKLGIIGLNSAFLQLTKEDYEGKLDLHVQQLQPACSPDLPTWLNQHDMAILMTHHPTTWLSKEAQEHFNENIYTPGRFLFHAFGHMHEPNQVTFSSGGAKPKRQLQGASLFGLEKYKDTIQRIHGYSIGSLSIEDNFGTLEIWPRIATKSTGGNYHLTRDPKFALDEDSGSYKENVPVKKK